MRKIYVTVLPTPNNTILCSKTHTRTHEQPPTTNHKKATCKELLTCLYNLKPTNNEILLTIAKNPDATLDTIAQNVHRYRSRIQQMHIQTRNHKHSHQKNKNNQRQRLLPHLHNNRTAENQKHAQESVKEITQGLNELIKNF